MIRINFFIYDVGRTSLGRNSNVTIGRAACEACNAIWNLGTNSAFALGPRKTTEKLDVSFYVHTLDEHQTVVYNMPVRTYMQTNIHLFIFVII
jgi:hypothetical protein